MRNKKLTKTHLKNNKKRIFGKYCKYTKKKHWVGIKKN